MELPGIRCGPGPPSPWTFSPPTNFRRQVRSALLRTPVYVFLPQKDRSSRRIIYRCTLGVLGRQTESFRPVAEKAGGEDTASHLDSLETHH